MSIVLLMPKSDKSAIERAWLQILLPPPSSRVKVELREERYFGRMTNRRQAKGEAVQCVSVNGMLSDLFWCCCLQKLVWMVEIHSAVDIYSFDAVWPERTPRSILKLELYFEVLIIPYVMGLFFNSTTWDGVAPFHSSSDNKKRGA